MTVCATFEVRDHTARISVYAPVAASSSQAELLDTVKKVMDIDKVTLLLVLI